jgi:hypothetical protein
VADFDPFEPIKKEDFAPSDMPEDEGGEEPVDLDMEDDLDLGEDEVDPIGDLGLEEEGEDEGDDEDFEDELGGLDDMEDELGGMEDDLGLEDEEDFMEAPQAQVKWTPVPTEDGTVQSEHEEGFVLRAKPLSSQQGNKVKYITQLYKGNKIIEKGTIWVESEVDAREYLQNVSDRILDRLGLFSNVEQQPEPTEAPPSEEGGEEDLLGGEEDLLGGEEGEIGEEELPAEEGGEEGGEEGEMEDILGEL